MLAAGEVVTAGKVGQEQADCLLVLPQSHEHGVAITATVTGRERDPLPGLYRQGRQQAVAEIDMMPIARGWCKEPRHTQSPAQQRSLVIALPEPWPMDFIESHEVEVFQAIGHAIDVSTAIGARAAVDIERADTEGFSQRILGPRNLAVESYSLCRSCRFWPRGEPDKPGKRQ